MAVAATRAPGEDRRSCLSGEALERLLIAAREIAGRSVSNVLVSHVSEAAEASRQWPAMNVAFVLDRSESMGGQPDGKARRREQP